MRPKEGEREAQRAKAVLITVVLALAHLAYFIYSLRYRNLKMTTLSNQISNSKILHLLNASFEQISGDETSLYCSCGDDALVQISTNLFIHLSIYASINSLQITTT